MQKVQTGIRFQGELLDKISYIAKQNHRSFNAQMEYLADECKSNMRKSMARSLQRV